jgi:hypothetical protein
MSEDGRWHSIFFKVMFVVDVDLILQRNILKLTHTTPTLILQSARNNITVNLGL